MCRFVNPVLAETHVPPASVDLKTPFPYDPAYSVEVFKGSIGSARTSIPVGPFVVQTLTPAKTVEAVRAKPTRTKRLRR